MAFLSGTLPVGPDMGQNGANYTFTLVSEILVLDREALSARGASAGGFVGVAASAARVAGRIRTGLFGGVPGVGRGLAVLASSDNLGRIPHLVVAGGGVA